MPAGRLRVEQDAGPLSEMLIPRLQRYVRQALDEVRALVRGEMREARHACESVLQRLELITGDADTIALVVSPVATQRCMVILNEFMVFVNKFANQQAARRIAHNRVVLRRLLQFHRDIDHLLNATNVLRAIGDNNDELVAWRANWKTLADPQLVALEQLSVNHPALLRDEPKNAPPQVEALGLLWFEYNKENAGYTSTDRAVLRNAYDTISRQVDRSPAPEIWLLPPYELEYDESHSRGDQLGQRIMVDLAASASS